MEDFFKYTGWLIALISLVVNFLQLRKNQELKNTIKQNVGNNSTANQQTHLGDGDNVNVGGNYRK